ncbi:hypothetical protein ACXHPX_10015, partial [Vibrio cincinnatiensis]
MINVAFFSAKTYDETSFTRFVDPQALTLHFHDFRLTQKTAQMARECQVVCAFVNDELGEDVLNELYQGGTRLIAMRCAGFDKVDLEAAKRILITTNFKLTKESIMAILFTKEEAMKDLPF